MNCSFKFVVFLRSSVLRINGVCSALMTACSRADVNVRYNLLLLITLFLTVPILVLSLHLSLSLSLSQSLCIFFSLCHRTVSQQAGFFSLCNPVSGCLIALPLTLVIVVHCGISSSGLLFPLVCHNLSLFKVILM